MKYIFLIKPKFVSVIEKNPYIDKIHLFSNISDTINKIKQEQFDFIVDLQNNRNSRWICWRLGIPNKPFPKLNFQKLLVVWFKVKKLLPRKHIVDRYFEAAQPLRISNDLKGLDFFINEESVSEKIKNFSAPYVVLVSGGSYYTKKIPYSKIKEICQHLSSKNIILLGDDKDFEETKNIEKDCPNTINLCGKLNLHESAYLVKHSEFVITSDTGLMHIAAAFKKKIYSLWGNTIPEFGMYPYMPHPESKIIENKNLWCRPCSKLGYSHCPLLHFECMKGLDVKNIV
ncbi:MAG: glycosyl hydrolase [Bacteroidia bacterium]|nr:MAG: glycosyl hydrolase [Bacteroidia bacterium]